MADLNSDLVMIDRYAPLPLFVYGTLMPGQPAFYRLAPSVVRSRQAVIHGLVMHDAGAYPVAVYGEGHIVGEALWLKEAGYAPLLDALEAYEGPAYRRERCTAHLADMGEKIEVWVFVGAAEFGSQLPSVAGGDWRQWLRHRQRR
jgi:gamma-glutamylcyclotransferase (GGCT)/AIG2-like uncharacterized protein YtfP